MLDTQTKRRIDNCRDILLGRVPDPKSQVEQITIAMIYKFMDDTDLESERLGGKRKFFTKGFEQYRWAKLVSPGVTGQEMYTRYSQALSGMEKNKNIPELFRDIFRNAVLPFNDPGTLRAFLREVDGFVYDHSERLGDAFEYLLSVLGSQGDAGQFRTPRHIIDFMVEIINPQKDETILDPACGTAGFLISAYKHIMEQNSDREGDAQQKVRPGSLLNSTDRAKLMRNIGGYDISPDMVRLSLVNMYLHGFANPKISEYDTLTSDSKWSEMADVILANPPFMSPKGGVRPHNRFQVQANRSEVLFVDYIAEHLTSGGRAAIVVPDGIIYRVQRPFIALRRMLVENNLAAVISLPFGVFNPYASVKTSILVLDQEVARKSSYISFFRIENDGFELDANRNPQKGSQLPQVKLDLAEWLKDSRVGGGARLKSRIGSVVSRRKILSSDELTLCADDYRAKKRSLGKYELCSLQDFCDVNSGSAAPQGNKYFENGSFPFVRTSDVGKVHRSVDFYDSADKVTLEAVENLTLREFSAGTVLFPKNGASTLLNHRVLLTKPAYVSSTLACIRPYDEVMLPKFLYHLLCAVDAKDLMPEQGYPSLRLTALRRLRVPVPTLEEQRKILKGIDSLQVAIDKAQTKLREHKEKIESTIASVWKS